MRGNAARGSSVTTLPAAASGELRSGDGSPYREVRFERSNLQAERARALRRAQVLSIALVALAALLGGGLLHHANRSKLVPYVVEVDRHGAAAAFGPAEELIEPDRRMIVHVLGLWVRSARTVTLDRVELRRQLERAYAHTGGRAVGLLNDWYRRHPPFVRLEEETVSVAEIDSVLSMGESEERFRVQWTEEIRTPGGALVRRELWQALVTVAVDPPEAIEEVVVNPLGIRVTDFDWQRLKGDA